MKTVELIKALLLLVMFMLLLLFFCRFSPPSHIEIAFKLGDLCSQHREIPCEQIIITCGDRVEKGKECILTQ